MKSNTPTFSFIDSSVEFSPMLNARKNIISGPGPKEYWNHSPGLSVPDIKEEGPLPLQGNIGSLLKQEGLNNYESCLNKTSIGGGPNCTGVFNNDIYTSTNTCGDNCSITGPESYGMQNFGMQNGMMTNMHGLHAYENVRAGTEGKGPAGVYGCYESIPNLKVGNNGACVTDYDKFEANTIGNWQNTEQGKRITQYNYRS
jgi:hypothetical protein